MASEDDHDDRSLREVRSSNGAGITVGNDADTWMRIEDGLAYCSEKLLNLETLLTELAGRSIDFGILNSEDDDTLCESVETALELDILSGILYVEAKELQSILLSIRDEAQSRGHNVSHVDNLEDANAEILYKLHDAEESLKKVQDLVNDVRKQPVIFERNLGFCRSDAWANEVEEIGNGSVQLPSANTKWISLTVDQQRHVLQQLEKSLARELDLEKNLSDSKSYAEELMLKLHYAERDIYCIEESFEMFMGKVFEAENAAELLFGISRELIGKLQVVHLNLTNSILREEDTTSQLQKSMKNCADLERLLSEKEVGLEYNLKEAKDHSTYAESENSSLKKKVATLEYSLKEAKDHSTYVESENSSLKTKVTALEEQLKEYDVQLQLANASVRTSQDQQNTLHLKITEMEKIIESLSENLSQASTNAEGLESKCSELSRTNNALSEELDFLRHSEAEKLSVKETQLRQLEALLEHAKASIDADKERNNILYVAIDDMGSTIDELKGKASKAEIRADIAESKCKLLTDANIELNEELGFLRGRVDSLEASLRHAEDAKVANAKEISARTKIITELIMKLALERESLQEQVSSLGEKRTLRADKSKKNNTIHKPLSGKGINISTDFDFLKSSEEAFEQSSTTIAQVNKSTVVNEHFEKTVSTEDSTVAVSNAETVRTIEAAQLSWTQLSMGALVLLVSLLTFYMYHLESSQT